jgi:uncharacterized protein YukE
MPAVQNSVDELMLITRNIQQLITNLENESQRSLTEWEGSVEQFYRQKKLEWDNAANAMAAAAGKAGAQLGTINLSYHTAEKNGTNLWS